MEATAAESGELLLAQLQSLGLEQGAQWGRVVSGSLPFDALAQVAELENLGFLRPVYRPVTNALEVNPDDVGAGECEAVTVSTVRIHSLEWGRP